MPANTYIHSEGPKIRNAGSNGASLMGNQNGVHL